MALSFRLVAGLLAILFLASCRSLPVRSEVTRFHRLPAVGNGETFFIANLTDPGDSIEGTEYAGHVAAHLTRYGWQLVDPSKKDPDYMVFIGYGHLDSSGRTVENTRNVYGQRGGGTTYHSGSVTGSGGSASYSGTSYSVPQWGVVGTQTTSHTVYDRYLFMTIRTWKEKETVFESRTFSTGKAGEIAQVLPQMIDALFKEFPGESGDTNKRITTREE